MKEIHVITKVNDRVHTDTFVSIEEARAIGRQQAWDEMPYGHTVLFFDTETHTQLVFDEVDDDFVIAEEVCIP